MTTIEHLSRLPLFERMQPRDLHKLARITRQARFAPGDVVVHAGDAAHTFHVVVSGRAGVPGPELSYVLRAGDCFGEMALIDDGPRSATVFALDELVTLEIPRRAFLELVAQEPYVARKIMAILTKRVRRLERSPSQPAFGWPMPGLS
jgi:CRP-like cAMP-binding protein